MLLIALIMLSFTPAVMGQTIPSYIPTNGLVGWWPFNGNANDESGNGNNGTVNGATLTADRFGKLDSAFQLNRSSAQSIDIANSPELDNITQLTLSIWYNIQSYNDPSSCCGYNHFINKSDQSNQNHFLSAGNNTGLYLYFNNSNLFQTNTLTPLNQWNNVVLVYAYNGGPNSMCSFYLNGVLTDSFPTTSLLDPSTFNLKFGTFSSASHNTVDGKIDDIAIWDRPLSINEIAALYEGCLLAVNTQPSNQMTSVGNNTQFIVSTSNPSATYQWQTDLGVGFQNLNVGGQYSGTTNDTLTVSNATMNNNNQPFRCVVSSGACTDTSTIAVLTVNNNVGLNEKSQQLSVYPNPAQSMIYVNADHNLSGLRYTIYDRIGKIALTGTLNAQTSSIDLAHLSDGTYIFSVGEYMDQTFTILKK